jgi:uncharacterized protein YjbI with pentapeptide repeats
MSATQLTKSITIGLASKSATLTDDISAWLNEHLFAALLVVVVGFLILIPFAYVRKWDWTGMSRQEYTNTSRTFKGSAVDVAQSESVVQEKTLWDWLQLFIIPLVLTGAVFFLNKQQEDTSLTASKTQHDSDQLNAASQRASDLRIAQQQAYDKVMDDYLDKMSAMLLDPTMPLTNKKSTAVQPNAKLIARERTLIALDRLDGRRRGIILRFLYDAHLIDDPKFVIHLYGSRLTGADLGNSNLAKAHLMEVNLGGAHLQGSFLQGSNLEGSLLVGAHLVRAHLNGADLRQANMTDAILTNANMQGAILKGAILKGVKWGNTVCPDGTNSSKRHPESCQTVTE